jgi:hypothetical protein
MTKKHTFKAVIQNASGASGGGAFVEIPFDVEKAFSSKKPKVKALIEGVPYRGTLVRMGTECHLLLILKSIREQVGRTFGDEVRVSVELDVEERVVTVPLELKRAFKSDKEAKAAFERLSYTHKKEFVTWIEQAKREETRARRVARTVEMLEREEKVTY